MSKKTKRQVRKTSVAARPVASPVQSGNGSRTFAERDFSPNYSHVINDLRRIGMLAGSFFVILIILSFILR